MYGFRHRLMGSIFSCRLGPIVEAVKVDVDVGIEDSRNLC
jgi:hypothetical protein